MPRMSAPERERPMATASSPSATSIRPVQQTGAARASDLRGKDLLSLAQLSPRAVLDLYETAKAVKANPGAYVGSLAGRTAVMLFEKASLRTRITFEGIGRGSWEVRW